MITVTYLPLFVTILFRGMPGIWKSRHRLLLCWLIFMQAVFPGHKTLEELARWTSAAITGWRFRQQFPLLACESYTTYVGGCPYGSLGD